MRGPDNAMWFTSVGAAKGIGHVDASGRGALTQVGGYEPESLTFGPDGAVWFTDAQNNVIVRVPTSELQTTNVDPGAGSVLTGSTGGGVRATAGKKPLGISKGKVPLTLTCTAASTCSGKVRLTSAKKVGKGRKAKHVTLTKPASFSIPAGAKGKVKLEVTGGRFLGRGTTKVRVVVGDTTAGKVKVRR